MLPSLEIQADCFCWGFPSRTLLYYNYFMDLMPCLRKNAFNGVIQELAYFFQMKTIICLINRAIISRAKSIYWHNLPNTLSFSFDFRQTF